MARSIGGETCPRPTPRRGYHLPAPGCLRCVIPLSRYEHVSRNTWRLALDPCTRDFRFASISVIHVPALVLRKQSLVPEYYVHPMLIEGTGAAGARVRCFDYGPSVLDDAADAFAKIIIRCTVQSLNGTGRFRSRRERIRSSKGAATSWK